MQQVLSGVFPVLPTPFDDSGATDAASLRRLVRYLLRCGVDGMTFPGVASEVGTLSLEERIALTEIVLAEVGGRAPVVVGASSTDSRVTQTLVEHAVARKAAAVMIAVPADRPDTDAQVAFYREAAERAGNVAIMLQNVPPPAGAGLAPEAVLEVLRAVPAIRYVKEETVPSGQRLTVLLRERPAHLAGVFGGAGGRYITDELRRGAAGTMPAIELAEVHVALFEAHRAGDANRVRTLFTRMLPILNVQAVYRWSLTKYVLHQRGLIASRRQRAAGPLIDDLDAADVDAFFADVRDLLLPSHALPR